MKTRLLIGLSLALAVILSTSSSLLAFEEDALSLGWASQFGTGSIDYATGISVDSTGVYVSGCTYGALPDQTANGDRDTFIRKYDGSGNELWAPSRFGKASS